MRRKFKKTIVTILVLVILIGALTIFLKASGKTLTEFLKELGIEITVEDKDPPIKTETDELSIHFMELGNDYAGDCVLIDVGDVEVLVDAGSRTNSADTIVPYINDYCTDGKLEYVIATHAHQDHIAAFVDDGNTNGIFTSFECEVIIDFPLTNATSNVYNKYLTLRDKEIANGAKHYTALECFNNQNGASREIELAENVYIEILYNRYYEIKTSNENNYSVCFLVKQGGNNYLFTGDLEEEGEEYLVQDNDLPECVLFKAGHHGSYTASHDVLLDEIKPEICVVTCVCGTDEYSKDKNRQFPSQDFISRICKHTDKVYAPSVVSGNAKGYESLNGNIVFISDGLEYRVECSNNNVILKETNWFKENRVWQ